MRIHRPPFWTAFEDNTGGFSCTRIVLAFITAVVMLTWATSCWHAKTLVPIPDNAVMLIIGFGGVKAVQRFGEKGPEYSMNIDPGLGAPFQPQPIPQPIPLPQPSPYPYPYPPSQPQPVITPVPVPFTPQPPMPPPVPVPAPAAIPTPTGPNVVAAP